MRYGYELWLLNSLIYARTIIEKDVVQFIYCYRVHVAMIIEKKVINKLVLRPT